VIHEIDAIAKGEWKMFAFLKGFKERTQKLIFLYAHLLLPSLLVIYVHSVFTWHLYGLFIAVNLFGLIHFALHFTALNWKSNVFKTTKSFISIVGMGFTGMLNLLLYPFFIA